jgi:membrane-associated phospholipid phosphatase
MKHGAGVYFRLVVLGLAACAFGLIAHGLTWGEWLPLFDASVGAWVHGQRGAAMTAAMVVITHAHAVAAVSAYTLLLVVALALRREPSWAWAAALAIWGGLIMNALIKQLFARPRPEHGELIQVLTTYSFPSGHTAGAALLYGVIAAYLMQRFADVRVRIACVVSWLALVLLVGYSRVYLGVHYPSDVLAAAAWAALWLGLCLMLRQVLHARRDLPVPRPELRR